MTKLQVAIDEIQKGNTDNAQRLLAAILKDDPLNEQAWLWLSQAVQSDGQRRMCLERVLQINPDNQSAQKGLMYLQKTQPRSEDTATEQHPQKTVETDQSALPSVVAPASTLSLPAPAPTPAETKRPQHDSTHRVGNSIQKNLDRLGQMRPTKWLSAQVNRQTGMVLSNSTGATLLLVVAGGILLASCITGIAIVLLMGFVIDREATGSLLQQAVYFVLGLSGIIVPCLLLLVAIGWIRGKWRQRTTSPTSSLAPLLQKLARPNRQKTTPSKPRWTALSSPSVPDRPQRQDPSSETKPRPQHGFSFSEQVHADRLPVTVENVSREISARFPQYECRTHPMFKKIVTLKKGGFVYITVAVSKGKVSPGVPFTYPALGFWGWMVMLLTSPLLTIPGMLLILIYYYAALKKQEKEIMEYLHEYFAG